MGFKKAAIANGFTVCENPTIGQRVHVEGWSSRCVFKYEGREGTAYILVTPVSKIRYKTCNQLLNTRRNEKQDVSYD